MPPQQAAVPQSDLFAPGSLVDRRGHDLVIPGRPHIAVTVIAPVRAYYGDQDIMAARVGQKGGGAWWDEIAASRLSCA
jgi:hypothetical protein